MTFLTAAQSAAIRLVRRKPQEFFSAQDVFSMEICDLANDVARDIMRANEWRGLTKLKEMTGDGTSFAFSLPDDYDRMLIKGAVYRPDWNTWHYTPAQDLDEWQDLRNGAPTVSPGYWIILAGQMQIWPPIPAATKAQFYYISNACVKSASGTAQAEFKADTDNFVLDDELLTLGIIWRWRAQNRLEYAEDMANYEKALAEIAGRDKATRIMAVGRQAINANVSTAYPWSLGGVS